MKERSKYLYFNDSLRNNFYTIINFIRLQFVVKVIRVISNTKLDYFQRREKRYNPLVDVNIFIREN